MRHLTPDEKSERDDWLMNEESNTHPSPEVAPKAELAKGCQCACHKDPQHVTLQDYAEANLFHIKKWQEAQAKLDQLKSDIEFERLEMKSILDPTLELLRTSRLFSVPGNDWQEWQRKVGEDITRLNAIVSPHKP
jgi:hypothetical protein